MQNQSESVISADSHFTEPPHLWRDHIEPAFRDRAPHVESRAETDVFVCDTGKMFPVGLLHGVRYRGGDMTPNGRYADIPPSGWDSRARLEAIESDGVYREVLYPTVGMRFFTIEDAAFGAACMRAYNTWAGAFAAERPDRFKAVAILPIDDVSEAVRELKRSKQLGLAGAMISVAPTGVSPYFDPVYDPLWAAAQALRMPLSLHSATERRIVSDPSPSEAFLGYTVVQSVLIGMIYGGVFDRFPHLQLVSVENDAGWAASIIERMDYFHERARSRNLAFSGRINERTPGHYWRNNISYTFMRDRTAIAARHIIGTDRLMWGSDFPHGDSTWPRSRSHIQEQLGELPASERRMLTHDNVARLYDWR